MKSDSLDKIRKDKDRDKLNYSFEVMSIFGAEGKEPSFEREKKKRGREKRREGENLQRVSGLGSRVSQELK